MRRRTLLASLAAGGLASAAGCAALTGDPDRGDESPGDTADPGPDYTRLARRQVYVAPDLSLSLPADVPQVASPDAAEVVVLPGATDVGAETGIGWLAAGTGVALVGSESQPTLVEWLESDAYAEQFESEGMAVASPAPDFLVAFGVDRQYVSTHRYTWNDVSSPSDERYLTALEDALDDAETTAG